MKHPCIGQIGRAVGFSPDLERLEAFADWLATEATRAGGIGPNEAHRIWERHVCDALAYALAVGGPPDRALDVGTGVGLPGLPLAISWPMTRWTLLDRSGRRVDLAQRAVRLLGLDNVEVVRAEPEDVQAQWPLVVSRATFPAREAGSRLAPLVAPGGRAVVGLHRGIERPDLPEDLAETQPDFCFDLEPKEVLDPPAWFLIIRPCE